MFKNIFITQLPQIPIKDMVEIWWQFGDIESYIYIKNDNQVIKFLFKFIFYLKMHFMTILGVCTFC